ncbi:Uncharacterised protein [Candidatus Bilamarchaeum dharawalense]|uniref:Uncharacterized protein n=1 Tax=Candidatus Bilamarchaeum dharawalense TaxID=2885759 RepID=A0A5E4LXL5_9ARCH|nr:Uncharacterised protein [Candidatus Bilamarchaeum dharawalense]
MEKFILALLWDDGDRWGIQYFKVDATDVEDAKTVAAQIIVSEVYRFYDVAYILSKDNAYLFSGSYSGPEFKKRKEIRISEKEQMEYRKNIEKLKQDREKIKKQLEKRLGNVFDEKNYIGPVLSD